MAISRSQMYRQLQSQGGIMNLETRQKYLFGGIAKKVKKAFKGVTGGIKDILSSDLGKAALLAAGGYYLGGGALGPFQRAGMSGFKFGNLPGASLFSKTPGGPQYSLKGLAEGITKSGGVMDAIKTGGQILGGSALLTSLFGSPLEAQRAYQRDPAVVKQYIKQYYQNINKEASEEEAEEFANSQLGEYAAKQDLATGGRVGFEEGGTDNNLEDLPRGLQIDTTTYNPIPEDADRQAATEIARTMMAVRSLPREDGELEDTETMSTKDFMINQYFKPKRKELMENYGLSLEEANNLIKEAVAEIRTKKADGGMPMGIMRTNQAGVMERDYREEGGFVPVGIKEKADDVPAMLSKNEFVMTADAVRGAGNGNIETGAQKMYRLMKTLENGGKV
jgi:hypothetical protein